MVKRLLLSTLCVACCSAWAAETPEAGDFDWNAPVNVKTLPYGNVLFEYYRGNTFESIRALQVAEKQQKLGPHQREAQALLGSMQLSYGLLAESEKVLTGAMKDKLPPAVKEQVLLSLARIRYRAGDDDAALSRLTSLPTISNPVLRDDAALMQANIYLRQKNSADAARVLNNVAADSSAYRYALFNLGVAQLQLQQMENSSATFAKLLAMPSQQENDKALRDRTLLAQGYDWLRKQQLDNALTTLRQVRLNGPYANNAMLGLGWAYARNNQYNEAIAPWQFLAERQSSDLAVQEGRLALPYAYQQMQALAESLTAYTNALASFDQEIAQLDAALTSLRDGETLKSLMARLPDRRDTAHTDDVVLVREGESVYLGRVLTSHEFNASFHRYQALSKLRDNMADWQRRLPVYQDMLVNHQKRFEERMPQVDARLAAIDIATQGERINRLRETVAAAKQEQNWSLLLNEKERGIQARLDRVQAKIERIAREQPLPPNVAEKYQMMRGLFLFEVARESADRQWQMQRELRDAEAALRQLNAQRARLLTAREVAAHRFGDYQNKIDAMQQRVALFAGRTETGLAHEEKRITQIAENELLRWRKQLVDYRYQAQLAVARMQDRASRGDTP